MYKGLLNEITNEFGRYISDTILNKSEQFANLSGAGQIYLFENKLKKQYGKKYVLTFCNATNIMHSLVKVLELKQGDNFITTPFNWGSSISPFLYMGIEARFTNFENNSFNMDVHDIENNITQKTKAVLSVDFNGLPADSKSIKIIAAKNNLIYISDSCQSLNVYRGEKPSGFYADLQIVSFGPCKSLYGGEGGAILTDNESIYEKMVWYTQHPERQKSVLGLQNINEFNIINGRMNPLSALMLNKLFEYYLNKFKNNQKLSHYVNNKLYNSGFFRVSNLSTYKFAPHPNINVKLKSKTRIGSVLSYLQTLKPINNFYLGIPQSITDNLMFKNIFKNKYILSPNLSHHLEKLKHQRWVRIILNDNNLKSVFTNLDLSNKDCL